jgi:hypothetical protein
MYAGLGAVNPTMLKAVRDAMVQQMCIDAGRPGDTACAAQASAMFGTNKSRDEIVAALRSNTGTKWLLWGAVGAVVLVGGAWYLTR